MKKGFLSTSRPARMVGDEGGMVSVETAVTMPVIVLVLALILVASRYGVNQVQACNQARNEARQVAAVQFPAGSAVRSGASSGDGRGFIVRRDGQVFVTVQPEPVSFLGMALPQTGCTVSFWDEGDW
ncbi:TadE family protein [Boudabousia marimammalium]|uniref:Pilus assembly protein TadE n=1 Tax=Boudabousia marimammalium TaxID=156892 RepID=A0A1Q5PTD3_9ACTO|nr:TadE family protein [Boudabousia marimammalium]OKL50640.1 hypothetical protein BM477_01425 [Boudabousia marimammalium]